MNSNMNRVTSMPLNSSSTRHTYNGNISVSPMKKRRRDELTNNKFLSDKDKN